MLENLPIVGTLEKLGIAFRAQEFLGSLRSSEQFPVFRVGFGQRPEFPILPVQLHKARLIRYHGGVGQALGDLLPALVQGAQSFEQVVHPQR